MILLDLLRFQNGLKFNRILYGYSIRLQTKSHNINQINYYSRVYHTDSYKTHFLKNNIQTSYQDSLCSSMILTQEHITLRHTPQSLDKAHSDEPTIYQFPISFTRWRGFDSTTPIDIHTNATHRCNSIAFFPRQLNYHLPNITQNDLTWTHNRVP